MAKSKRPFAMNYRKYDDSKGHGSPNEWRRSFTERMGHGEAVQILSKQKDSRLRRADR